MSTSSGREVVKSKRIGWLLGSLIAICALYLVLMIPGPSTDDAGGGELQPFVWDLDAYWSSLEAEFRSARLENDSVLSTGIVGSFATLDSLLVTLRTDTLLPDSPVFADIESEFFTLAVLLSASPSRLPDYMQLYSNIRRTAKDQSVRWDMNDKTARDCIYRLLYGGRTAIEEAIMQSPQDTVSIVMIEPVEPSETPSITMHGVTVHSGDLLVSRGGAPTSAFIARGNDYPGNFSHSALAYIDEITGEAFVIESIIEEGVRIVSGEKYLSDTKLRVLVLRVRSDLPAIQADPLLPHKAATYMYNRELKKHIPYDFTMNTEDDERYFCSDVVSGAYRRFGVNLWAGRSNISRKGVRNWLATFGATHFITHEPSDLEYDPQLRVVAEWRDYEKLEKDRIDNAVVDVLLESADSGVQLEYNHFILPIARIVKIYCVVINQFGWVGPIPEGMSAMTGLKSKWFSKRHGEIKEALIQAVDQFKQDQGYSPPYWEIVRMAREAQEELFTTDEAD